MDSAIHIRCGNSGQEEMSVRAIKVRVMRRMYLRFHGQSIWQSAEYIAWDRIVPVGREFGSPDFDRLMELDNAAFSAFGSIERVRKWLDTPNDQLGGMPPEDVARSPDGWAKVMNLLRKAD